MKKTMKKITASLLALLILIQIVPAMAATYSSGVIVGTSKGFKEKLEIVASKGTYVLLGQTLVLDVNEDYDPVWKSADETIATIDQTGMVTALQAGIVEVTASQGEQSYTVEVTVIDPDPILQEAANAEEQEEPVEEPAEEPKEEKAEESAEKSDEEPKEETTEEPVEPTEEPVEKLAQKIAMVIVINAESQRVVYDGEEHLMDGFEATSNEDSFDPSKIKVNGDLGVRGTDCGLYELKLEDIVFSYDDPNVIAHFVVNNGWMKITPASVTVTANEASKNEGDTDPELTVDVVGLFGDDTIEYTLTRTPGEAVGEYEIEVNGEEQQGNYRINYVSGKFVIEGKPTIVIEVSIPDDQEVYLGTKVVLKAVPYGFGDAELAYQWQWSLDDEHWTDIEGATGKTYTFYLDETNYNWYYNVDVTTVK